MPLIYIPLDISKCCEYLNIENSKYVNKYIYDKFSDFFDYKFCPFEINKNKSYICGRKVKGPNQLCFFHKNKINKNDKQLSQNNFILNINNSYFEEYKKYLYSIDNYNDIIYETYVSEYLSYKNYLNNINYDDNIICSKYIIENNIKDIVKYTFNTDLLYTIINDIKNKNENFGNKYYYHYISKYRNIIEVPKFSYNPQDMKIILYKNNSFESFNSYMKNKYKKYIKNKKKNNKKKNKKSKIEIECKKVIPQKVNYVENDLIFRDLINFVNLKKNKSNENDINLIINFIDFIKYNKYLSFYSEFIKINIDKLLNLNKITNTVCFDYCKYKKVIIFNKNNNLSKILKDINYELNEIPQNQISWFGNSLGIINYNNKYNIDLGKTGIKIYKKNDNMKKHKLNTDQLYVFYC